MGVTNLLRHYSTDNGHLLHESICEEANVLVKSSVWVWPVGFPTSVISRNPFIIKGLKNDRKNSLASVADFPWDFCIFYQVNFLLSLLYSFKFSFYQFLI